jgi:photosystem II stability/assembly factor-like uncharacterized protein
MQNLFKRLFPLSILLLSGLSIQAQSYLPSDADSVQYNLFSIEKKFLEDNARLALTDSIAAAKKRKHFNRWAYEWRDRVTLTGDLPDIRQIAREKERFWENQRTKTQTRNAQWHLALPEYAHCVGRVNAMAMHPSQPNIIWAATASGGVWRTTTGGKKWALMAENVPNVGKMGQVVIAPSAPNTVYATTKDHGSTELFTTRLLKTTDGGATWQSINLESFGIVGYTSRLLVHPNDPNKLLLASYGRGVFQSFDGGNSWQRTLSAYMFDMCYNPLNPETVFAVTESQIWVSYDGGQHFILRGGLNVEMYGARLTMTAADTNRLYFSNNGLTVSYDAGVTLNKIQGNTSLGNYGAFYANCIAVSPHDASDVFLGGIKINRVILSGVKAEDNVQKPTTNNPNTYIHPDHQFMQFVTDSTVLLGNDGGAWVSYDGGHHFEDITNNMTIMEYYTLSHSPFSADEWMAGAQDNGTHFYSKSDYSIVFGGDGMDCFFDYSNPKIKYYSYQSGNLFKNTTTDSKFGYNTVDLSRQLSGTGAWITPFLLHPTNPKILYAGYEELFRSNDAGETALKAVTSTVSKDLPPNRIGHILRLRTTMHQPDAVYFCNGANETYKFDNRTMTLKKLTKPNLTLNNTTYFMTDMAVSALDSNTILLTAGGYTEGVKVLKSIDGGKSWRNISEGLPNILIKCIVEQPNSNGTLYLGTEIGVFRRDDNLREWEYWSKGLPNVSVNDLKIQYTSNVIRAATYGRAIWESPLEQPSKPLVDFTNLTGETENEANKLHWTIQSESGNDVFTVERSSDSIAFYPIKTVQSKDGFSTKTMVYTDTDLLPNVGDNYYRIRYRIGYNNEKKVSNIVKLSIKKERNLFLYPNPTDDLLTVNFRVRKYPYLCQLEIFSINGNLVLGEDVLFSENDAEHTLNIRHLASGTFILRAKNKRDEIIEQATFIKK